MCEGPCPNGVTLTPRYYTFIPELKVDQVLKGDAPSDKPLLIEFTILKMEPKDPPEKFEHHFSFKIDLSAKPDEIGLPGSPRKGTQYIFFLQNRDKHEPKTYMASGKKEIVYRTFDYWFGMIPASATTLAQLKELAKG